MEALELQPPAALPASADRHVPADLPILYWGTPVVVVSTLNADGSANLAPISSAFWLGSTATLGFGLTSHTLANLDRTPEAVLCLPSAAQADAVDRLALTTGADPVPPWKAAHGYRHVRDKAALAGVTTRRMRTVAPPAIVEFPVAMAARVRSIDRADHAIVQLDVVETTVHASILAGRRHDRIDPLAWRPLLMAFQRFFTLGGEVRPSRLSSIPEEAYRQ